MVTAPTLATQRNAHRHAILLLLFTALLWSSSGLFVKIIDWGPLAIWGGRNLISFFVTLAYLRRPTWRWTPLQVLGALAYMGSQIFFIMGTKLTTVANVIFLTYTSPLYLVLLSYWFLGERPKRADWGAMAAIFAGMLLFLGDDLGFDSVLGNLYGILCGISMAVMALCMRGQKSGAPANTILLGNLLGGLIGLPFLLTAHFTWVDTSIMLYLGLFQMGLSFVLYSIAIRHVPALESMLILTLEPILSPIWVFLVLGETPGPLALLGALLVLGAVLTRAWLSTYQSSEEPLSILVERKE